MSDIEKQKLQHSVTHHFLSDGSIEDLERHHVITNTASRRQVKLLIHDARQLGQVMKVCQLVNLTVMKETDMEGNWYADARELLAALQCSSSAVSGKYFPSLSAHCPTLKIFSRSCQNSIS